MRELFLLDPEVVFLNHGSFGATPRPVFEDYQRHQLELEREPVEFLSLNRRFPSLIEHVRSRLAAYVGARAEDLVLVPNATTGVNLVARSLDLQPGDEVVATTHEYGGNQVLFEWLCERSGARFVELDTLPARAVDDLLGAVTPRTRLIFVSHVTSPTALRFPVEDICAKAHEAGVPVLVDGAHAPSQLDLDLESIGADWYTGNCHKWLCSPKGAGFLHVRPDRQAELEPAAVSWDWAEESWADRHRWHGTKDPAAYLAVPAAIDFQAENDWPSVRERCHALADRARNELSNAFGTEPLAASTDEFVQMATVRLPASCDAEALGKRLIREHHVEIWSQGWRGESLLRVSFQGYNDESDLAALMEAVPRALQ